MSPAGRGARDSGPPELLPSARGVVLRLRCRPGRPETRATGTHGGALCVDLAAPPEHGKANRELLAWLARFLDVPKESLGISAGEAGRDKSVRIEGVTDRVLRRRLDEALSV